MFFPRIICYGTTVTSHMDRLICLPTTKLSSTVNYVFCSGVSPYLGSCCWLISTECLNRIFRFPWIYSTSEFNEMFIQYSEFKRSTSCYSNWRDDSVQFHPITSHDLLLNPPFLIGTELHMMHCLLRLWIILFHRRWMHLYPLRMALASLLLQESWQEMLPSD